MRVVLEMLASLWYWFLCRFGAVGCLGNWLFHYKVVSLQSCFATKLFRYKLLQVVSLQQSRFATHTKSIRYTSKVVSLQTPETQKSICYINQ